MRKEYLTIYMRSGNKIQLKIKRHSNVKTEINLNKGVFTDINSDDIPGLRLIQFPIEEVEAVVVTGRKI